MTQSNGLTQVHMENGCKNLEFGINVKSHLSVFFNEVTLLV